MTETWLVTWRTYGTWLPGQPGFVGQYRNPDGHRRIDNQFGTSTADAQPALQKYASDQLRVPQVNLVVPQAEELLAQLQETCRFRGWSLTAVAILVDHIHLVTTAADTVSGTDLLRDLKSYCSRRLNRHAGRLGRWCAERGSTRRLLSEEAVAAGVEYVLQQQTPLLVWHAPHPAG